MKSSFIGLTVVLWISGFGGFAARASSLEVGPLPRSDAAFIAEYDLTLAPLQFVKFCMNYGADCNASAADPTLPDSDRALQMLSEVNLSMNRQITPTRKSTEPLQARWTLSPSGGDCNDYAVTKRHRLIAMGWPTSALRLAVAFTQSGEGHLVLVARLREGDYVLDNLSGKVRKWNAVGYDWVSMQSAENPRYWVMVSDRGHQRHLKLIAAQQKILASNT